MADTKRPKLSLPAKPAGESTSTRRSRPPLRGNEKPRPPRPAPARRFADGQHDEGERGERRSSRDGERPSFRDRPRREDAERPARTWGERDDHPRRNGERHSFRDRPRREEGGRAPDRERGERPARPYADRDGSRPSYRDRDGESSRRPRRDDAERPARTWGDREEHPRRNDDDRPSFRDRGERQARPYAGRDDTRPRREGERSTFRDRPRRDNDERPPFRERGERPARPYADRDDARPARPSYRDRDGESSRRPRHDDQERPARTWGSRDERPRRSDEERPSFRDRGERPAHPYAGRDERPRREGEHSTFRDRPHRDEEERPAFRRRDAESGAAEADGAPHGKSFSRSRRSPQDDIAAPSVPAQGTEAPLHIDAPGAVRLSKRMAELGLCSRREADEYIERGWVSVDGIVIAELGSKILPNQHIELAPVAEEMQMRRVTVLINKPIGYVSGQAEDGYEPAAVLITPENHWSEDPVHRHYEGRIVRKLAPAGRLDIDSTGLLVLTQDGRVAKHIVGEHSDVEKEYLVRVQGALSDEGLRLLRHGLELDGIPLHPAKVSWQNEDQLRFVLREGRKRQIRRMCELVGLHVVGLKRIRIGRIPLGALPVGQWRYLGEHEEF